MIILIFEFIFFILMLPIAMVLTLIEVLVKVLIAVITGKREIKSFFSSSYSKFASEITAKCKSLSGGGGEK